MQSFIQSLCNQSSLSLILSAVSFLAYSLLIHYASNVLLWRKTEVHSGSNTSKPKFNFCSEKCTKATGFFVNRKVSHKCLSLQQVKVLVLIVIRTVDAVEAIFIRHGIFWMNWVFTEMCFCKFV